MFLARMTAIIFFTFLIAGAGQAHEDPIGEGIKDIPLFDAHMHYKEPAWEAYPVQTVIELKDKTGVALALVSSTPDEGTIRLREFAPDRIVAELRPYHGSAGSSNWTKSEGMLDYIKDRLKTYSHVGIGEFHIHTLDRSDGPLLQAIAELAQEKSLPLHIHSGAEPVEYMYSLEPEMTIIWAHAGMSEPPEIVDDILTRYPNTYVDTSYRERDILAADGTINPAWRIVIDKHTDRIMVGTDTWVNSQWDDYEGLIALNRLWLKKLPREQAEKIAYKNALRLFNRSLPQIRKK
ncbi:MAG: amidohydrolase family protein [Sneathiella sp.]